MSEIHPAHQQHSRRALGPLSACLLAALLFGASTPLAKQFTASMSPWYMAGMLYAGAGLSVSPWALAAGRAASKPTALQRAYLLGALVCGGVIGPVLFVMGLQRAAAGSVALWLNLETVATAVLARTFFKEHIGVQTWLGVLLIIGASALLSAQADAGFAAVLCVALACVMWGLDNNLTSLIGSYSATQITFAKGLLGASINIALGIYFGAGGPTLLASVFVMGVGALGYGISLVLYVSSARELGATRSQLIFSTAPAWGLALSWLWLGEPVLASQLMATLLMLIALWLYNRERHSHHHHHDPLIHSHLHSHDDGHHQHVHATPVSGSHEHEHTHEPHAHSHPHLPDQHHRHSHD